MSTISLHFRGKSREDRLENSVLGRLARSHFRLVSPPQFSRKEPRHPLLKVTPDSEKQTIASIWRVLMRYTGDCLDYRHDTNSSVQPYVGSVISRLSKEWGMTPVDAKQDPEHSTDREAEDGSLSMGTLPNKPKGGTLRHIRATLSRRLFKNKDDMMITKLSLEDSLMTSLEYVHFIASCGILKSALRDEIYCMICKHLVKNPSKTSISRCWLLLTLVIGCFPPSNQIHSFILEFIEEGPSVYSTTAKKLLEKSIITGARFQPPSYREMDCYEHHKAIEVQVTLMDGTLQTVVVDGTSTSQDISQQINDALGLRHSFGYSIFIAMCNKVASLGCGADHVMDAISQCEQLFRGKGGTESAAPWRLFYRKELFAPWEDTSGDIIAVSLAFAQITRGIMLGEYTCDNDQDLAVLAARQYFTEYGSEISEDGLEGVLPSYIPAHRRPQPDSIKAWRRLVTKAHQRLFGKHKGKEPSIDQVKLDVVNHAKNNWALAFSRLYDVYKLEGPPWSDNNVKLAINSTGVDVLSSDKTHLHAMHYTDITTIRGESNRIDHADVTSTDGVISTDDVVLFVLADGSFLKFETPDAVTIRQFVTITIDELHMRSKWAEMKEDSNA